MNRLKKKFIYDILVNLLSSSLPLITLQLVAMPLIARQETPQDYGIIIVLISILTLISFPLGNVLNNIRLIKNDYYSKYDKVEDFQFLGISSSFFAILVFVNVWVFGDFEIAPMNIILQTLILVSLLLKDYWIVEFRIKLNFLGLLINNILLSFGYLLGIGLYYISGYWEIIYLSGMLLACLHIFNSTKIWKEPLSKSISFKSTFQDFIKLYIAGLLKNLINYADKILLLPLLGPISVAIYFTATIVGKILSMVFSPISSVILSYLTKSKGISNALFFKGFLIALVTMLLGYVSTIVISPFILNILYPDWAEESLKIIYITTAAIYISILSSLFQPFNLRYNKMNWQVYMSISTLFIFIISALLLTPYYGLYGYSNALLISNSFYFVFQFVVFLRREK